MLLLDVKGNKNYPKDYNGNSSRTSDYFSKRLFESHDLQRLAIVNDVLSRTSHDASSKRAKELKDKLKFQVELLQKFSVMKRILEVLEECEKICQELATLHPLYEDALYPERKVGRILSKIDAELSSIMLSIFSYNGESPYGENVLDQINDLKQELNEVRQSNISIKDAEALLGKLHKIKNDLKSGIGQNEQLSRLLAGILDLLLIIDCSVYYPKSFTERLGSIEEEVRTAIGENNYDPGKIRRIEIELGELSRQIQCFDIFAELIRRISESFSDAQFNIEKLDMGLLRSRLSNADYSRVVFMLQRAKDFGSSSQIIVVKNEVLLLTANEGQLYYTAGTDFMTYRMDNDRITLIKNSSGNNPEEISFISLSSANDADSINWLIVKYNSYVQKCSALLDSFAQNSLFSTAELVAGKLHITVNGHVEQHPLGSTASWLYLSSKGIHNAIGESSGEKAIELLVASILQLDLTQILFANRYMNLPIDLKDPAIIEDAILAKLAYSLNTYMALLEIYSSEPRLGANMPFNTDYANTQANRNVLRELKAKGCISQDMTLQVFDEAAIRGIALDILNERINSRFGQVPNELQFNPFKLEI